MVWISQLAVCTISAMGNSPMLPGVIIIAVLIAT